MTPALARLILAEAKETKDMRTIDDCEQYLSKGPERGATHRLQLVARRRLRERIARTRAEAKSQ